MDNHENINPLKANKQSFPADGSYHQLEDPLPILCQELYYKYCVNYSNDSFEAFYDSTYPVFISFAFEKINGIKINIDPQEIVNRLYGILVAHAANRKRIPIKVLLSWCFGVISNLIKEEQRNQIKSNQCLQNIKTRILDKDPLELIIKSEETQQRQKHYQWILNLILSPNNLLSNRERNVMKMFYCVGLPMKKIAVKYEITTENVAVMLYRARKRIAALIKPHVNRNGRQSKSYINKPLVDKPLEPMVSQSIKT